MSVGISYDPCLDPPFEGLKPRLLMHAFVCKGVEDE